MPTLTRAKTGPREKPWEAKVQLDRKNYYLGHFAFKSDAIAAEERFKGELRQITAEAHAMWRQKAEYLRAVATVAANANGR